ncbi:MAG: NUDIX domain-containing protein [Phenylobacterium sp.]|uniref:NUDIX hydrolase n=1 Tax=Phenylobacterium sp. TaxID=1871053 RepID=UPI0025D66A88|nr:CoA pyrophosphatase [Phenylobacterium sp.]MBI1197779.1 NUDIX domain-containing protein [Phenylobacterium sp.]
MQDLRARIEANFAGFSRIALPDEGRRRAAVAIVLSPTDDGPAFFLTRRAQHLRRNAGNYALPGGHTEPGEDAVDTARRETAEELGVSLPRAAALGLLDDLATLGGHVVTPVVFWSAEPLVLAPNPDEVWLAWAVPIADLDHPEAPRAEANPAGGPAILRMHARGDWVNPPTAAFLLQFREVCLHGRECRTDGIGQPSWTAR